MEKVKYLIIFTLLMVLGLLYFELLNHKQLTTNLIDENNFLDKDHKTLQIQIKELQEKLINLENNNINLNETIRDLRDNIIALEENLTKQRIDSIKLGDINYTIENSNEIYNEPPKIESNETNFTNETINILPKVTLDSDNNIDSIQLEYKDNF